VAERSEKEKMLAGELYFSGDPQLGSDLRRAELLLHAYNGTSADEPDRRAAILRDLLGDVGENTVVRPPFYCDYGLNIRLGSDVFLNYGCVFLDVVEIAVGDHCQIGPVVQVYAADHPRDPDLRRAGIENGKPVRIGSNVWIGGGAIILPGVIIGDDAVVGAGSVVTRNVPAGATVAGNPARVLNGLQRK
jgi:maltose O-acetyltransferase